MFIARCTLAVAAAAATLPATAASYVPVADWNGVPNPNGAWSFLSGSALLPYWASMAPLSGSGGDAPTANTGSFLPVFWQPGGSGTDVAVHSYDGFNGGGATGEAVLGWTSPITGTIELSGYFYYGQASLFRSNDVTVALGASTLLSTTVSFAQHRATPAATASR